MGFAFVFLSGNCLIAGQAMPSCEVADDLQVAAARGVEARCLTISVLRREVHAPRHADLGEFETPLSHAVCAEKRYVCCRASYKEAMLAFRTVDLAVARFASLTVKKGASNSFALLDDMSARGLRAGSPGK